MSWPHRWHLEEVSQNLGMLGPQQCESSVEEQERHTNVPRVKEREDSANGKDVIELRKGRHLDGPCTEESQRTCRSGRVLVDCTPSERPDAPYIPCHRPHMQNSPSYHFTTARTPRFLYNLQSIVMLSSCALCCSHPSKRNAREFVTMPCEGWQSHLAAWKNCISLLLAI
jgi:hypothetical protein